MAPWASSAARLCAHAPLLALLLALLLAAFAEGSANKNVVMLMIDDLANVLTTRAQPGETNVSTPNIDRLVDSGAWFPKAHAQIPICGASRMSLMTGPHHPAQTPLRPRPSCPVRPCGPRGCWCWVLPFLPPVSTQRRHLPGRTPAPARVPHVRTATALASTATHAHTCASTSKRACTTSPGKRHTPMATRHIPGSEAPVLRVAPSAGHAPSADTQATRHTARRTQATGRTR